MTDENAQNPYPQVKPTFQLGLDQNLDTRLDPDGWVVQASRPIILYQGAEPGHRDPNAYLRNVESNRDLTIYGDVVKVMGKIKAPGRKIVIFARVLQADKNGEQLPELDVSGDKGDDAGPQPANTSKAAPGARGWGDHFYWSYNSDADRPGGDGAPGTGSTIPGANGKPGNPGGSIHIVCQQYEPVEALGLCARGGDGGCGGRGGQGQAGGDGGPGDDAGHDPRTHYSTPGGNGGPGGKGGPGGQGGTGGNGGKIVFLALEVLVKNKNMAKTSQRFDSTGDSPEAERLYVCASVQRGENGDPGEGGPGGKGGNPGPGGKGWWSDQKLHSDPSITRLPEGTLAFDWDYYQGIRENYGDKGHQGFVMSVQPETLIWDWYALYPSPPGKPGDDGDCGDRGDPLTTVPKDGTLTLDFGSDLNDFSRFTLELQDDGSYRIKVRATNRYLHEDGTGDKLLSTRYQTTDNYGKFRLMKDGTPQVAQADVAYAIQVVGDGRYLHEDGTGDMLVSTRYQPDDDLTRFILEDQRDGSYRIRDKASGRYLNENRFDRLVSSRELPYYPHQTWDLLRQLRMSYQRARALYLTIGTPLSDPEDKEREAIIVEVYRVLAWISLNLEALQISADPSLAGLHSSLAGKVNSLLGYYSQEADAFGHYNLFVPRGSFSYYYEQLDQAMALLYRMETDYAQTKASFAQMEDFLGQVDQKAVDVSDHLDALDAEVTMTSAELGQVADLIRELDGHTVDARWTFEAKIRAFQADLEASTALDMDDLFGALEMMAFSPSKAMGMIQAAKLGYSFWKEVDQVETDSGRKVNKNYIVTRIKDVTGDFSKLGEGFRALKSGQSISQDDPGAARLMVTQSQFEQFFDEFLSRHSAMAAKEALNEYVDSIQKRNVQIDAYNLLVMRYLEDKKEIKSLQAQQNLLAAEANTTMQHRQKAKDYLSSAYNSLRDRCVRLLYMTGRAYYFLSLQPLDILGDELQLGQPDEINLHSIIMAKIRIIDAEANEIERRVTPVTPAPPGSPTAEGSHGATIAYIRNKEDGARYNLVLESPDLLDRLSEDLEVSVPLEWDDLKSHGGYNPFSGKANVRLRRVRCWIYGLQTGNRIHRIRLLHDGDENIICPNGESIEFEHKPLLIPFEYDGSDPRRLGEYAAITAAGGSEMPLLQEGGSFIGQGIDLWDANHYAPVGPFTNWRIMIGHDLNAISQPIHIDKLVLEFFYYYDPAEEI